MNTHFKELFTENRPELKEFLTNCSALHLYSEEKIEAYSASLRLNRGELEYRIQARRLNTQSVGTGEDNYEKF